MNQSTWILLCLTCGLGNVGELKCQSRSCTKEAADTARAAALGVYRGCEVDRPARLQTDIRARPLDLDTSIQCHKAAFDVVVDTLGVPEIQTARLLSTNSNGLADAVRAGMGSLRYRPAKLAGVPVRQLVVYEMKLRVRVAVTSSPRPPGGTSSGRSPGC